MRWRRKVQGRRLILSIKLNGIRLVIDFYFSVIFCFVLFYFFNFSASCIILMWNGVYCS